MQPGALLRARALPLIPVELADSILGGMTGPLLDDGTGGSNDFVAAQLTVYQLQSTTEPGSIALHYRLLKEKRWVTPTCNSVNSSHLDPVDEADRYPVVTKGTGAKAQVVGIYNPAHDRP